ncbi:MAG: hypothetical protein ABIL11_08015 [Chloroflexota bacterium]
MTKYKTPREAIYKTFIGNPGPCPQCGGALKKSRQSYMVLTRSGNRMEDSFVIGSDFGWFCQSCPVVVLDKKELEKMMGFNKPGWKIGAQFAVAGIIDLDAVPADKQDLPLGAPGNPLPLIKFRAPGSGDSASRQKRQKK